MRTIERTSQFKRDYKRESRGRHQTYLDARLGTTNSLQRLHTEIKRRIRSAGAFPDRASALRLITAVALRTTAVWSERRYLDLSLLEPKEVAKAA